MEPIETQEADEDASHNLPQVATRRSQDNRPNGLWFDAPFETEDAEIGPFSLLL